MQRVQYMSETVIIQVYIFLNKPGRPSKCH